MDSAQVPNSRLSVPSPLRLILLSLIVGIVGGVLLFAIMMALSSSYIGGADWTLRGNGALVVPFVGGPALVAGGWVALALLRRNIARSKLATAVAGTAVLVLALVDVFSPIVAAAAQEVVGAVVPLVALVVGAVLGALIGGSRWVAVAVGVVAWLLVLMAIVFLRPIFYILGPLLLAPIVAWPLLAVALIDPGRGRASRVGLLAASILLPVFLFGGILGAGRLFSTFFGGI